MKIEGAHDIPAPRQKVWEAFLDPERLRQAIPGCEKLEALGNDEFKAVMKVGVAAVKGTFEGKVRPTDIHCETSGTVLRQSAVSWQAIHPPRQSRFPPHDLSLRLF